MVRPHLSTLLLAALFGAITILGGACAEPIVTVPTQVAATPRSLSPEDLQAAIRFRMKVGFRSDAAYVLRVATDLGSEPGRLAYGTPLLPAERTELDRRAETGLALSEVVEQYGQAHAEEWAGAYLDTRTGEYVALFTNAVEKHAEALALLVKPSADLGIREAKWTYDELHRFELRVANDAAWLQSIGATYSGTGIDVVRNVVELKVSSGDPDAPRLITEHFDGDGWLRVDSDGIGPWKGAYGSATIAVLTRSGPAGSVLMCSLSSDVPVIDPNDTILTGDDGVCRIGQLAATGYDVEILVDATDGSGWKPVGRGRLVVQGDREATVTIQTELP